MPMRHLLSGYLQTLFWVSEALACLWLGSQISSGAQDMISLGPCVCILDS